MSKKNNKDKNKKNEQNLPKFKFKFFVKSNDAIEQIKQTNESVSFKVNKKNWSIKITPEPSFEPLQENVKKSNSSKKGFVSPIPEQKLLENNKSYYKNFNLNENEKLRGNFVPNLESVEEQEFTSIQEYRISDINKKKKSSLKTEEFKVIPSIQKTSEVISKNFDLETPPNNSNQKLDFEQEISGKIVISEFFNSNNYYSKSFDLNSNEIYKENDNFEQNLNDSKVISNLTVEKENINQQNLDKLTTDKVEEYKPENQNKEEYSNEDDNQYLTPLEKLDQTLIEEENIEEDNSFDNNKPLKQIQEEIDSEGKNSINYEEEVKMNEILKKDTSVLTSEFETFIDDLLSEEILEDENVNSNFNIFQDSSVKNSNSKTEEEILTSSGFLEELEILDNFIKEEVNRQQQDNFEKTILDELF